MTGWCTRVDHTSQCQVANFTATTRAQDTTAKMGRLLFPLPLFAYPFYLWHRSPGKTGSHYDPKCDLFTEGEKGMVLTSNAFMIGMLAVLATLTVNLGPLMMFNLYFVPYWVNVVWLDVVTYLHHHGSSDKEEKMPWYRCALEIAPSPT